MNYGQFRYFFGFSFGAGFVVVSGSLTEISFQQMRHGVLLEVMILSVALTIAMLLAKARGKFHENWKESLRCRRMVRDAVSLDGMTHVPKTILLAIIENYGFSENATLFTYMAASCVETRYDVWNSAILGLIRNGYVNVVDGGFSLSYRVTDKIPNPPNDFVLS